MDDSKSHVCGNTAVKKKLPESVIIDEDICGYGESLNSKTSENCKGLLHFYSSLNVFIFGPVAVSNHSAVQNPWQANLEKSRSVKSASRIDRRYNGSRSVSLMMSASKASSSSSSKSNSTVYNQEKITLSVTWYCNGEWRSGGSC